MELIIKNFDKLEKKEQDYLKYYISTLTNDFILVDQLGSLKKWVRAIKEKEDLEPTHIDLDKILDLLEKGEIEDPSLILDPKQKTLTEVFKK